MKNIFIVFFFMVIGLSSCELAKEAAQSNISWLRDECNHLERKTDTLSWKYDECVRRIKL